MASSGGVVRLRYARHLLGRHRRLPKRAFSTSSKPQFLSTLTEQTTGWLREFTGPDPRLHMLEEKMREKDREIHSLKCRIEDLEHEEAMRLAEAEALDRANSHPILGKMVADLGYKKIYRASISTLKDIPMWDKQRSYRDARAKAIAKDKKDSVVSQGFPGILTAYIFTATQKLGLLDGQHRLGAHVHMSTSGLCNPSQEDVLVEVFDIHDGKQAEKLFVEINKAEPVKTIDMPNEANPTLKNAIDQAVDHLAVESKEMFKVSSKCLPPHVNIDILRDDLYEADVCGRHSLRSKDSLLKWLVDTNAELAKLPDEAWAQRKTNGKKGKQFQKALEKARKNNFFLGMDKLWLNE